MNASSAATAGIPLRLTAIVVGLALGVLLAEVSVRVYAGFQENVGQALDHADPMGALVAPYAELGYRQRPNRLFRYANGTVATSNAMGYRGPLVAVPKPPGTFRIVLLGESTTHGWGVPDSETIDAHLRILARARYPDSKIEVVNLAFDGYDSRQLLERLRSDGMPLEPDLVIANTGINDVRNARFQDLADPDQRTLLWADVLQRLRAEQASGPTIWTRVKHYSYLARLPAIARQYRPAAPPRNVEPNLQAAEIFERNLTRIATLAADAGIPLMISTPPSALDRCEPHATSEISYWIVDAATTQRFRDELARRAQRVVERERARGREVGYLAARLPPDAFLDDTHLTASGNRRMAAAFLAATARFLDDRAAAMVTR